VVDEDLIEYGFTGHEDKRLRLESANTGCRLGVEYAVRVIYSDKKVTKSKVEYLAATTQENLSATIHGALVPAVVEYVDGDDWSVEGLGSLASTPSADLESFSRAGGYLLFGVDPETGECMVYEGSTGCLLDRYESHITEVMKGLAGRPFQKKRFYQWCVEHKVIPKCVIVMFDDTEDNEPHFNEVAEAVMMSIFNGFQIDRSLFLGWQAFNANAARHKSLPAVPWAGGNASWPVLMGHATSWPGHQDFHEKQCSECEFKCFKEPTMAAHQFLDHRVKRYKCPFCDESYHDAAEAKEHAREYHPKAWVCEVPDCGKSYNRKDHLTAHVKTHEPNRPKIRCTFPDCTKEYTSQDSMSKHLQTHDADRQKVRCTFPGCTQEFMRKGGMKTHLQTHDPDGQKVRCTFPGCTQEFTQKGGMTRHLQTHDPNSQKVRCTSSGCTREFSHESDMKKHLKTHDADRQKVRCTFPDCTKEYTSQDSMSKHLKTHVPADQKVRVPCTFLGCTQTFSRTDVMTRHVKKQHPTST
jgi:uncharacterized Zn-finger protein